MTSAVQKIEPQSLTESIKALREVMEKTPAAAEEVAIAALDARWRKRLRQIVLAVSAIFALFIIAGVVVATMLFGQATEQARRDAERDVVLARTQATIDAFEGQLKAANVELVARGLPPIEAPLDPLPGTPEQAQLITAAGTATTLATLPEQVIAQPSAADLAQAVADYVNANQGIFAPNPQQIIDAVAAYFATNPVLDGEQGPEGPAGEPGVAGPQGPAGPPPSAEEIRAAFRDEIAANPQLLCPLGGTFSSREVLLAGGGSTTDFSCFGEETTTPDPDAGEPSSTDDAGQAGGGGAVTSPPPNDDGSAGSGAPQAPEPVPAPAAPPSRAVQPPPADQGAPADLVDLLPLLPLLILSKTLYG